jgi:dipeptidyl aminopeptidase/acylaminoacyl peptidase
VQWLRASRRRAVAVVLALVVVVPAGAYVATSSYAYGELLKQTPIDTAWCRTEASFRDSTPAAFQTGTADTGPLVDTAPYLMPDFEEVSFPSRETGVTITAWWVPAATQEAPAVILVHGRGKCRGDPEVLLPAGMLHRAGFAVLLIDLRNHGGSTVTDGRQWFGVREYPDVLGAWDWLRSVPEVPAEGIGLYGVSLGGASSLIAMGEEPRVAATWEDSSFASVRLDMDDGLAARGLPLVLDVGTLALVQLRNGVDLATRSPVADAAKLDGRPIAIVHGDADQTAPVIDAGRIADAVRAAGGSVDPWIVAGARHVRASFIEPAEYERRLVAFFSATLGAPGG